MKEVTKHLINSLKGNGAHVSFSDALKDLPYNKTGEKVEGLEHSIWMLVYHIWICANDIVEFSIKAGSESPTYPSGYWPANTGPSSQAEWNTTIEKTILEMERMVELLEDESNDLFTPFPWGSGQNLFKEALVLIDHNSYHIAQIVDLRFLLGVPLKDW